MNEETIVSMVLGGLFSSTGTNRSRHTREVPSDRKKKLEHVFPASDLFRRGDRALSLGKDSVKCIKQFDGAPLHVVSAVRHGFSNDSATEDHHQRQRFILEMDLSLLKVTSGFDLDVAPHLTRSDTATRPSDKVIFLLSTLQLVTRNSLYIYVH